MFKECNLRVKEALEKYAEGQIGTDEELLTAMEEAIAETVKDEEDASFAEGWMGLVMAVITGQIDKGVLKKIESLFGPSQARMTLLFANKMKARGDDINKRIAAKMMGSFIETIDRLDDIPMEEVKEQISQQILEALSSAALTPEEEEQLKLVVEVIKDPAKVKDIKELDPELKEQFAALEGFWNAFSHMNEVLQVASQRRATILKQIEDLDKLIQEAEKQNPEGMRELVEKVERARKDINQQIKELDRLLAQAHPRALIGLLSAVDAKPPLPSSLEPFKQNGLAPYASGFPAYGAAEAMFAARRGWPVDDEGLPRYIMNIDGNQLKGRVIYHIILPWDATEEEVTIAHKELAWNILKSMGPDTAWLHMLLLAYAVDPTRRDDRTKKFVIPRKEIYHCLGLDKRSDLTRKEKDYRALEEIKKLRHLGLQIVHLQWAGKKTIRKKGKSKEVDLFNWDKRLVPLWEIWPREFGQSYVDWDENGKPVTRYEDWQLIGSEGPWGDVFLHGEDSLRQFGYMARDMLEKVDRYHCPWGAALAVKLTFISRFNPGGTPKVSNREIIIFAGGEEYPTDRKMRHSAKQQVMNAIEEQRKWGWEPDYSLWPEYLRPGGDADKADNLEEAPWDACPAQRLPAGYWDDFLQCVTIFRPTRGSQAEAMVQANQQVKHLPEAATLPILPEPEKPKKKAWIGSDIKELRKKLRLTQKQLAAYLKVSPMLISHFETGRRKPSPQQKQKLTQLERNFQK